MLRFFSSVFSRKNRSSSSSPKSSSPKSSSSASKSRRKPKSILKKSASTRKKTLSFATNIKSVREYAPENTPDMLLKDTPLCHPIQRPRNFPCRIKNSIFEDSKEFNEYARDVSDKIISQTRKGLPSVSAHYKTMKTKLKSSGSYKKKVPPEHRFYDEESGRIIDVRMFPDEEEE